jgi:hypothetical protein
MRLKSVPTYHSSSIDSTAGIAIGLQWYWRIAYCFDCTGIPYCRGVHGVATHHLQNALIASLCTLQCIPHQLSPWLVAAFSLHTCKHCLIYLIVAKAKILRLACTPLQNISSGESTQHISVSANFQLSTLRQPCGISCLDATVVRETA